MDGAVYAAERAIDELVRLGGFFELLPATRESLRPDLRSFAELYEQPDLLETQIESVRQRHETVEPRVPASIAHLGLASRLVSPALAAACAGVVLELLPATLFWQEGQIASHLVDPRGVEVDPTNPRGVADLLREPLLERHLRPLGSAVRSRVRVSERLLWGNAASAIGGAVQMISQSRPEWADRADAIGSALIERGPMASLGSIVRPDPVRPHRFFVRRSCCLYYRAPRGGMCGDCSLLDSGTRLRQWRSTIASS